MTIQELRLEYARKIEDAQRFGTLAPLATVLSEVLRDLENLGGSPAPSGDEWLTPADAAEVMGVTRRWIYNHRDQLPWVKKIDGRNIRCSRDGLRRYMLTR